MTTTKSATLAAVLALALGGCQSPTGPQVPQPPRDPYQPGTPDNDYNHGHAVCRLGR